MGYQDFIKVGKYCRFSLFLYSFKKEHYYLSEKTIVLFVQKVLSFCLKSTIVFKRKFIDFVSH